MLPSTKPIVPLIDLTAGDLSVPVAAGKSHIQNELDALVAEGEAEALEELKSFDDPVLRKQFDDPVLCSDSPDLLKLLAVPDDADSADEKHEHARKRFRRNCKTKEFPPSSCKDIGGIPRDHLAALVATPSVELKPAVWAAVNVHLKLARTPKLKKGEKKPKKSAKKLKESDKSKETSGTNEIPFQVWLKREHSAAYHAEVRYAMRKLGLTKETATTRAREKGKQRTAMCQTMRAEGKLPEFVVV